MTPTLHRAFHHLLVLFQDFPHILLRHKPMLHFQRKPFFVGDSETYENLETCIPLFSPIHRPVAEGQ